MSNNAQINLISLCSNNCRAWLKIGTTTVRWWWLEVWGGAANRFYDGEKMCHRWPCIAEMEAQRTLPPRQIHSGTICLQIGDASCRPINTFLTPHQLSQSLHLQCDSFEGEKNKPYPKRCQKSHSGLRLWLESILAIHHILTAIKKTAIS